MGVCDAWTFAGDVDILAYFRLRQLDIPFKDTGILKVFFYENGIKSKKSFYFSKNIIKLYLVFVSYSRAISVRKDDLRVWLMCFLSILDIES